MKLVLLATALFGGGPLLFAAPEVNRVALLLNNLFPTPCTHVLSEESEGELGFHSSDIRKYQVASVDDHRERAVAAGLGDTPELDLAFGRFPRFVPHAHRFPEDWPDGLPRQVLEIGAGGGRVIDWLLKSLPTTTRIDAVDFSERICDELRTRYAPHRNVHIHTSRVEDLSLPSRAQVAFALFSYLWDMDRAAKHVFFDSVYNLLGNYGIFVVDVRAPEDLRRSNTFQEVRRDSDQSYFFSANHSWWLHTVEVNSLINVAALHNFTLGKWLAYETADQHRVLYVFVKGLA